MTILSDLRAAYDALPDGVRTGLSDEMLALLDAVGAVRKEFKYGRDPMKVSLGPVTNKAIKRRVVANWRDGQDEASPPTPIYCSDDGLFYAHVGSEEVSSLLLRNVKAYLRDNRDGLGTSLLEFRPKLGVSSRDGKVHPSRSLYAEHPSGRIYSITSWHGHGYGRTAEAREWQARLRGDDWIQALIDGVKKGWSRVRKLDPREVTSYRRELDYTQERWEAAQEAARQARLIQQAVDREVNRNSAALLERIASGTSMRMIEAPGEVSDG